SAVASVAQQIHVPFLRRDVFLDNIRSEGAVRSQIGLLIRRAKIEGTALAIGHPHESTLRALSRAVKEFEREKISVVPAGELMPAY
ncbi:MAG TPA: divergent polysaccharide deacetylase family protein, partial [Syntrophobacteraceae bacterium]|nr:divergent polysaccharide deacetylase family protein [Syntrophobacteraceae bacterium]